MESSILAQNERWRRVLSMQVGRQAAFGQPRANSSKTVLVRGSDGSAKRRREGNPDRKAGEPKRRSGERSAAKAERSEAR